MGRIRIAPGVYTRASSVRRHRGAPDVAYDIKYRAGGKGVWECVGWHSEGVRKADALAARAERVAASRRGAETRTPLTPPTLGELWTRYHDQVLPAKKDGKNDLSRWTLHLAHLADVRVDRLTPLHALDVQTRLRRSGRSPKTIANVLELLRRLVNASQTWGLWQGDNPVPHPPRVKNHRLRHLTRGEAQALLAALGERSRTVHDVAATALYSGMRLSEILRLTWRDVDLDHGVITIPEAKAGARQIPLAAPLAELLAARRPPVTGARMPTAVARQLVFPRRARAGSGEGPAREMSSTYARVVEDLGFNNGVTDRRQRVVFHTLRHTFASWLAESGAPLHTIASLLGQSTHAVTALYSHLSPTHQRAALDALFPRPIHAPQTPGAGGMDFPP